MPFIIIRYILKKNIREAKKLQLDDELLEKTIRFEINNPYSIPSFEFIISYRNLLHEFSYNKKELIFEIND